MYHSRAIHRLAVVLTIFSMVVTPGCSRKFWREQAEEDAYEAIAEKQSDQRWLLPRINITPDERSRFYNPYDQDNAPMPPDDPAAHEFMHCANGMKGYKSWHKFGDMPSMENPQWLEPFGVSLDSTGAIDPVQAHSSVQLREITLPEAIELSYIHSRDYQTELEDLYLEALALTFQRFEFGVRYLTAGGQGEEPTTGIVSSHERGVDGFGVGSNFGIRQMLPAGGQWAIELANNTLWVFGIGPPDGANGPTSAGSLAFTLVQPLLFEAGRQVAMEGLTQAERDVLYATRNLARFRRTFFTDTSTSYLNILAQRQRVKNQVSNIERLEEQIRIQRLRDSRRPFQTSAALRSLPDDFMIPESMEGRLRYDEDDGFLFWRDRTISDEDADILLSISEDPEYQRAAELIIEFSGEGNDTTSLRALQLLTQLSGNQNDLRNAERTLQDQLDTFKTQLGLPPDIDLEIDTSLLEPFQLIDDRIIDIESGLKQSLSIVDRGIDEDVTFQQVVEFIDELDRLAADVADVGVDGIASEFDPVEMLIESDGMSGSGSSNRVFTGDEEIERVRKDLIRDRRLYKVAKSEFDEAVRDLETLKAITEGSSAEEAFEKLDADMDGRVQLAELDGVFDANLQSRLDTNEDKEASAQELIDVVESIAREIREPILFATQSFEVVQAGLRTELIGVNKFRVPGSEETPSIEEVVRIGLENRLDLMNTRAEVMDARRQLEIEANTLEGTLNLRVEGGMGTNPGSAAPFDFRRDQSQLNFGLDITTPLDRVQQRNSYAEALVTYQRARRDYMEFEDDVKTAIRSSWRQLEVSEQRLEIDRQQIRQAALQYDNSAQEASRGGQTNALNLLQSLGSLLDAQNSLINDWIQYELNRLNIYRDMGIMEIDPNGVWNDEFYQQGQNTPADPGFNPPITNERPLNLDELPTNEPIFPIDAVPAEPLMPEAPIAPGGNPVIAPAPPQAARGVRRMDRAWFSNFGRRRRSGDSVVASQSVGDVRR